MPKSRIDKVSAQFFRKGRCHGGCGRQVEQFKTFYGATLEQCQAQADAWSETPIFHRKCRENV